MKNTLFLRIFLSLKYSYMSEEKKYSIESMVDVNPLEHMRYRPAMYIGRIDELGNIEIIKALFEFFNLYSEWDKAHFTYISENSHKITFNSTLNFELSTKYFLGLKYSNSINDYLFQLIVGLSEKCNIKYKNNDLYFEKGKLISEKEVTNTNEFVVMFQFDATILHSKKLPKYLLFNFFKRHSFLYPKKEIHVFENKKSVASFSSNGIQDWFETQSYDAALLMKPFQFSMEDEALDLKAEIMFSMHHGKESFSTITLPRADFIRRNGTHTKGFLKGFHRAIKEILGETTLKLSEYQNLIGVFKLTYPTISFYGPTQNEVGSEELVEIFEKVTYEYLIVNTRFRNTMLKLFGL